MTDIAPPDIGMDDYQSLALDTCMYQRDKAFEYLVAGLCAEAGEVAGKFAKHWRGDKGLKYENIADELGDVLWFIAVISKEMGIPLSDVARANAYKLASRKERGVLQGDGDNR